MVDIKFGEYAISKRPYEIMIIGIKPYAFIHIESDIKSVWLYRLWLYKITLNIHQIFINFRLN